MGKISDEQRDFFSSRVLQDQRADEEPDAVPFRPLSFRPVAGQSNTRWRRNVGSPETSTESGAGGGTAGRRDGGTALSRRSE